MVYRLRPLQLELDCEVGPYKLGEKIDLTVELTPNADVDAREGRVDLVCEERYLRSYVYTGPGDVKGMGHHGMPKTGWATKPVACPICANSTDNYASRVSRDRRA